MSIHSKDRTPTGTMIIPSKSTLTVQEAESEKGAYIGSSEPYSTNEGDMIPYLSHPANQTSTGSGALKDLNLRLSDTGSVLKEADFIWKFDDAVNIEVACNVPGHYQAGMIAEVNIK